MENDPAQANRWNQREVCVSTVEKTFTRLVTSLMELDSARKTFGSAGIKGKPETMDALLDSVRAFYKTAKSDLRETIQAVDVLIATNHGPADKAGRESGETDSEEGSSSSEGLDFDEYQRSSWGSAFKVAKLLSAHRTLGSCFGGWKDYVRMRAVRKSLTAVAGQRHAQKAVSSWRAAMALKAQKGLCESLFQQLTAAESQAASTRSSSASELSQRQKMADQIEALSSDVKERDARIEGLGKQLVDVRTRLLKATSEADSARNELAEARKLQPELTLVRTENDALARQCRASSVQIDQLRQELASKSGSANAEAAAAFLERDLAKQNCQKLHLEISELESQNLTLKSELISMQESVCEAEKCSTDLEKKLHTALEERKRASDERSQLVQSAERARSDNQELVERIKQYDAIIKSVRDEILAAKAESARKESERESIASKVGTLLSEKSDLANQVSSLQESLQKASSARAELEAKLTSASYKMQQADLKDAELSKLRLALEEQKDESSKWKTQVEVLKSSSEALKVKLDHATAQMTAQSNESEENKELWTVNRDLKSELKKADLKLKDAKSALVESKSALAQKEEELVAAHEKLKAVKTQSASAEARASVVVDQVEKLQAEIQENKALKSEWSVERDTLKQKLKSYETDVRKSVLVTHELEAKNHNLESKNHDLETEVSKLGSRESELRMSLSRTEADLHKKEQAYEHLKAQLMQVTPQSPADDVIDSLRKEVADLKKEVTELSATKTHLEAARQADRKTAKEVCAELEALARQREQQVKEKEQQVWEKEQQLKDKDALIKEKDNLVKEKERQLREKEAQVRNHEITLRSFESDNSEQAGKTQTLAKTVADLETQLEDAQSKFDEAQRRLEETQEKLQATQDKLSAQQTGHSKGEEVLKAAQGVQRAKDLQAAREELESTKAQREEIMDELHETRDLLKSKQSKVAELEDSNKQASLMLSALRQETQEMMQEVERLKLEKSVASAASKSVGAAAHSLQKRREARLESTLKYALDALSGSKDKLRPAQVLRLKPLSDNVAIDLEGTFAEYTSGASMTTAASNAGDKESAMHGVCVTETPVSGIVLGRAPGLISSDGSDSNSFVVGFRFDVVLTDIAVGAFPDGLTVGFTKSRPHEAGKSGVDKDSSSVEHPASADDVPETWAAGFNGQVWDGGNLSWTECAFRPNELKSGDKVTVVLLVSGVGRDVADSLSSNRVDQPLDSADRLPSMESTSSTHSRNVTSSGPTFELVIFVNGSEICRSPKLSGVFSGPSVSETPIQRSQLPSLFGVVDLLGSANGVSILPVSGAFPSSITNGLLPVATDEAARPASNLRPRSSLANFASSLTNVASSVGSMIRPIIPPLKLQPPGVVQTTVFNGIGAQGSVGPGSGVPGAGPVFTPRSGIAISNRSSSRSYISDPDFV